MTVNELLKRRDDVQMLEAAYTDFKATAMDYAESYEDSEALICRSMMEISNIWLATILPHIRKIKAEAVDAEKERLSKQAIAQYKDIARFAPYPYRVRTLQELEGDGVYA